MVAVFLLRAGGQSRVHPKIPDCDQARAARHCQSRRSLRKQPARVARQIVDAGFTPSYDYALQTIKEIPYVRWREYNPEDAVRFYALRLREAGMIKSSPNKILADGTDWRHWNELKRELKG